jgi:hypothetical protein
MANPIIEEEENLQEEVDPTPVEVIKQAFRAMASDMRVSCPGEVVRYDHKKQLIDVRPVFKRRYKDGKVEEPPIIYNVPVMFPRAGESFVALPMAKGHSVTLVFSDRSLEKWLSSGKVHDPEDTRMHHMSDAMAIPGGYSFNNAVKLHNNKDIIIRNKNLEARIKPNGKIQVLNGKHELIKVMDEWISAELAGSHNWLIRVRRKLRTFLEK